MNKQGKDDDSAMKKPLILAIETSGRNGSVALAVGEKMLAQTAFSAAMKHNAEIFPAAIELLSRSNRKPREIEQVYISAGPGSFTGLRIAVTLAKMMHLANNVKVIAVDTLDVIAANITANESEIANLDKFAVILDAKRGQFFVAVWQMKNGVWEKILPDCLMTATDFVVRFADSSEPLGILGEGLVYYKDSFQADGIFVLDERFWSPNAEKVHFLGWQRALSGEFTDAAGLKPNYLRGDGAKVKRVS
ncbi:MAG: tRNA (adenosine(37)-N6)-threonylcarbamoyltransferase complex dimerization subunit type 1 TsaB [Planctomycetes bacterium]|nr:tRNA (adenosine(37)-N6)-threonylcarbamoyltransferase complex dimerization subunit type 1 TsaB [Planctomycetota bacterium]